ncbi:MAG TPA: magnesium transporter CorA family protein [Caulobacteraceae bacterium]|jgi:magnesium transporter
MLKIWRRNTRAFETPPAGAQPALPEDAIWIELVQPTRPEELAIERGLGLELPTREDMAEIEASSRLYRENDATFMTAVVLCRSDAAAGTATAAPITFVLTGERLVTIRYDEPSSFVQFAAQAGRQPALCCSGAKVFVSLVDAIVDRTADILEQTAAEVEKTSAIIFARPRNLGFEPILARLGQHQRLNAKAHESLVSLGRMIGFSMLAGQVEADTELRAELRSLQRDVQSLLEHSTYLSSNISFMLEAALGLISVQQNEITKIFSIAAVLFLPPTLIAGIYGMNFAVMPELHWEYGYPFAWALIVGSVLVSILWFKRKGWL